MNALEPESPIDPAPERSPSGDGGGIPPRNVPDAAPAKELTPEEQMAAFEKDLKENDWGHQLC